VLVSGDFDVRAATWDDDPRKAVRARAVAATVRGTLDLQPRPRVLEYGAGTGLLSQQLTTEIGPLVLADPSEGMREVMVGKLERGVFPEGTRVLDLDLTRHHPLDERFDLILAMMVLHHIPDLVPVLTGFATMLADGGTVCIIDLEAEDGSFHRAEFDGHRGFRQDELADWMATAGFGYVSFHHCHTMEKHGRAYPLFLAAGRRS
jgi:SAM-dependent methyltransferase